LGIYNVLCKNPFFQEKYKEKIYIFLDFRPKMQALPRCILEKYEGGYSNVNETKSKNNQEVH